MNDKAQQPPQGQGNVNINVATTPVYFTDVIFWNISDEAVVMNYGQRVMGSNQVNVIARVAVTKEHFKRNIQDISKNIALTQAKGQTERVG